MHSQTVKSSSSEAIGQAKKLVMMANQIARALAVRGETRAVPEIADHIKKFWTAHMRDTLRDHVAAGGGGLEPLALKALQQLPRQ